jgi:hypothetical protein
MTWAQRLPGARRWAVEDCRHVAGALIRALIRSGQAVVMVPATTDDVVIDRRDPTTAMAVQGHVALKLGLATVTDRR